jgi:hypothetical protein
MKRALILIGVCLSLAAPAVAVAQLQTATRIGSSYVAVSATGSCTVTRSPSKGTATLRCGGSAGVAAAAYAFSLPKGCGPGVKPHVDAVGDPSVRVASRNGAVRVTVRIARPAKVVVAMVSIGYSC